MNDDGNIQSGDVINPPSGPFWPKRDRVKMSQVATATANAQIKRGNKDAVYISGRNLVFEIASAPVTVDNPTGSAIKYCRVTGWSDEVVGTTSGYVYKPPQLRTSIYSSAQNPGQSSGDRQRIDGLHTYTPSSVDTRIDGKILGGVNTTWDEVIWPAYFVGEIIVAAYIENFNPIAGDGSDKFIWQDVNVAGRQWGWIDTVCYKGVTRKIVNIGSKPY